MQARSVPSILNVISWPICCNTMPSINIFKNQTIYSVSISHIYLPIYPLSVIKFYLHYRHQLSATCEWITKFDVDNPDVVLHCLKLANGFLNALMKTKGNLGTAELECVVDELEENEYVAQNGINDETNNVK